MVRKESRPHNSTYTQVGVQCFYESEVLKPSSVLLMKFSAKNPHLRVAAERYMQYSPCGYKIKICQNRTELKINKPHKTKTLHRKIFSFFSAPFLPTHICTFAKSLC